MHYVNFDDTGGYKLRNENNRLCFSSDETHDELFFYIYKDLSQLPELLKQYVSKGFSIETFEQTGYKYNRADGTEIIELLKSSHPYNNECSKEILVKAIGEYINLLLYHLHNKGIRPDPEDDDEQQKWYNAVFSLLTGQLIAYPMGYANEFFTLYKDMINERKSELVSSPTMLGYSAAIGFSREQNNQRIAREMLYWLLDISAPGIGTLEPFRRIWLYRCIISNEISSEKGYSYSKELPLTMYDIFKECSEMTEDEFRSISRVYAFREFDISRIDERDTDPEILKHLSEVAKHAKEAEIASSTEKYGVENLLQLLSLEIYQMIQSNTLVRRCKNCNRYFVIKDRKIQYCNRKTENGENTCSEIGSRQTFQKKMEQDSALKLYNRAYKTHHARCRSGKMEKSEFYIWCTEAKEKLKKAREGTLDIYEYEEWLKI